MLFQDKDINGLPVHVTQICVFECQRRILKTIIGLAKGINFKVVENEYIIAGRILHGILQETFKFHFSKIQYYYHNLGLDLEEAIYKAMLLCYNNWMMLFNIPLESSFWVDYQGSIVKIDEICTKQLKSLAIAAKSLINDESNLIQSLVLGDEFQVSHRLKSGIIITGRIDMFSRTLIENTYRIIELKTGSKIKESDKTQIKLYGEIFSKSFPDYKFELELWYTKNKRDIIKRINLEEDESCLNEIEKLILKARLVKSISDLPEPSDPHGWCRFNYNCSICQEDDKIFNQKEKTDEIGLLRFIQKN